jgi:hypothetical protein
MTTAQKAAIARRPTLRSPTRRMIGAAHYWHDEERTRFVVYRTAGGVTRKTSVRYDPAVTGDCLAARLRAHRMARALGAHPAHLLRSFKWPT